MQISTFNADEEEKTLLGVIEEARRLLESIDDVSIHFLPYTVKKTQIPHVSVILKSLKMTVLDCAICIQNESFADAFTLLRKYRDDVCYGLYLIAVGDKQGQILKGDVDSSEEELIAAYDAYQREAPDEHERNGLDWAKNKQGQDTSKNNQGQGKSKKVLSSRVLQYVMQTKQMKAFDARFKLQGKMNYQNETLNNYVHSNGWKFLNCRYVYLKQGKEQCKEFQNCLVLFTLVLLVGLTFLEPTMIMSSDWFDYKECEMEPPPDSEHWVNPQVTSFLANHGSTIDDHLLDYLRSESIMFFE